MSVCDWALTHPLLRAYHDEIWCRPCHDDRLLFEYLVLESFQAGLSWLTILKKKEAFEEAFDHFEIDRVAAYDQKKIEELLTNPNIVRHRRKIENSIRMAQIVQSLREEYGSFDAYIWHFTEGKIIDGQYRTMSEVPTQSPLSAMISQDLYRRGCCFVGPVIIYSYLQAIGILNDHLVNCPSRT